MMKKTIFKGALVTTLLLFLLVWCTNKGESTNNPMPAIEESENVIVNVLVGERCRIPSEFVVEDLYDGEVYKIEKEDGIQYITVPYVCSSSIKLNGKVAVLMGYSNDVSPDEVVFE